MRLRQISPYLNFSKIQWKCNSDKTNVGFIVTLMDSLESLNLCSYCSATIGIKLLQRTVREIISNIQNDLSSIFCSQSDETNKLFRD